MTKSKVRKLGDKIRTCYPNNSEEHIIDLEKYRVTFQGAITQTYEKLYKITTKVYPNAIVTYRIKRIESIISKLVRIQSMKLERMGDIAGCRCILTNRKQVYKLRDEIYRHFNVTHENDYMKTPQSDGYRSLHLYIRCDETEKIVEIQLRTKEQHGWATFVEITDLLYNESVKEKNGDTDLGKLHYLLSVKSDLSFVQKKVIIEIIKKYRCVEELTNIFTTNYYPIRVQWNQSELSGGNYVLIEASKGSVPQISSYESFRSAEQMYFRKYIQDKSVNRVLAYLPRPTFKKISLAYSNYVLTYHQFIESCYHLIIDQISICLRKKKYFQFLKYFDYFFYLSSTHANTIINEVVQLEKVEETSIKSKTKEWIIDIRDEVQIIYKIIEKLNKRMREYKPGYLVRIYLNYKTKRIYKKYQLDEETRNITIP